MPEYFNDSPIETAEDDSYGISSFAQSMAKSILNIKTPIGTTIALNGPWGSGKSSAVNLIRSELKKTNDAKLVITDFNCWWYRGEEALALAFFQNLNSVLQNTLGKKVKNIIPKIGRGLLQAGPVIGPAVALATTGPFGAIAAGSAGFAKRFFPEGDTLEQTFSKLSKILAKEDRRFLVIIDDIDRLSPDEALAIFRLIKSVGRLPNIMYLLVFDRALADKAVMERHPSEGPHYLEKVIQASFELPVPLQSDLNRAVLTSIESICGNPNETQIQNIMNIFYDAVVPYITTPRHVVRFQNAISVTWPAIKNEINTADFIALETIRLYEPSLFKSICSNKNKVCGTRQQGDPDCRSDDRFIPFLSGVPAENQSTAKLTLQRLFPRLEEVGYDGDFYTIWDEARRVCIEKHFDTYFRLSLSDETLPVELISTLIERANDQEFIRSTFLEATKKIRKNGTSMIPVYLEELTTHASKITKDHAEKFLTTLFNIQDEVDLECDEQRGFGGLGGTTIRYHWLIRRLTARRFNIEERTNLYLAATQTASLGWLVDFTSSAKDDYKDRETGPQHEEDCLTTENAIPELVDRALTAIRSAAQDGTLLKHDNLLGILYRWRDFNDNDPTEIREWTKNQFGNIEALIIFADKFTGETWSHGLGIAGLGDRVSKRTVRAQISDDIDILDPKAFWSALNQINKPDKLDEKSFKIVSGFLNAWDQKRNDTKN